MSEASIYTDGAYLDANPDWHSADSPYKAEWIADILSRNDVPCGTIAEIGCGAGGILQELHRRLPASRMSGFDISPQAISLCSEKAGNGIDYHLEDLTRSDRHFDVLLAIDVFEHVPDYMGFISALRSRATYKLFHIPLDLSVQGMLRGKGMMHAREAVGHLHYFDKDSALATLRDCGHEIIDWRYTLGSEELPGRRLRTRFLNAPRKALRFVAPDFSVRLLGGASLLVLTR